MNGPDIFWAVQTFFPDWFLEEHKKMANICNFTHNMYITNTVYIFTQSVWFYYTMSILKHRMCFYTQCDHEYANVCPKCMICGVLKKLASLEAPLVSKLSLPTDPLT